MNPNPQNSAHIYELLFKDLNSDMDFYEYFIKDTQGPALEIGSGTGRLLLNYLKLGFNVQAIEPDTNMSELCLQKAHKLDLNPVIRGQKLQELNLQEKYKTIYMPLYVFQNIASRKDALTALQKTYEHLMPGGQVLISIFIPWNDPTGTWEQTWRAKKTAQENKKDIILSESVSFDKFEQIETKFLKYEIFEDKKLLESYLTQIAFRCYSRFELTMMLEKSGFKNIEVYGDYRLEEADSNSDTLIFRAMK